MNYLYQTCCSSPLTTTTSCILSWSFRFLSPGAALFATSFPKSFTRCFAPTTLSSLKLILLLVLLPDVLSDCIKGAALASFANSSALTTTLLARSHHLIEVLICHIVASLADSLFKLIDLVHILTFFSMLCLHFMVFESFVELFILRALLLLFKCLYL